MERTYQEKTKTVYHDWDPYEDCYGYGCDRTTCAFKRSVEKLQNYIKEGTIFTGCKTGLKTRIEFNNGLFEFKRADKDFVMYSSKYIENVAEYIWISAVVGACVHHLYI